MDLTANHAVELLDFFQDLEGGKAVRLETKRTAQPSPMLTALKPVQAAWMESWLKQWPF